MSITKKNTINTKLQSIFNLIQICTRIFLWFPLPIYCGFHYRFSCFKIAITIAITTYNYVVLETNTLAIGTQLVIIQ